MGKGIVVVVLSIALTGLCWGAYGPILHKGQTYMAPEGARLSRLRPLMCVGIAYFLIAIVVPIILLNTPLGDGFGESGSGYWTFKGTSWSLFAGVAGAVGALGIVLAHSSGGKPYIVMPIVFATAPIVNSLITIWLSKRYEEWSPLQLALFLCGLIMISVGSALILFMSGKTTPKQTSHRSPAQVAPAESGSSRNG